MQRHHGVAAGSIRQSEGRSSSALGVSLAIDPREAVARHPRVDARGGMIDGKMQSYHRITAIGSGECPCVIAGSRESFPVPFIAVAHRFRKFRAFRMVQQ